MHGLLDDVLVGSVLLASCSYALMSLGPRAVKRRLLSLAAGVLKLAPQIPGFSRAALRLQAAAAGPATGSCGGCDNCASAPAQAGSSAAPSAQASAAAKASAAPEIRIPVSRIGRRQEPARAPQRTGQRAPDRAKSR